MDKNLMPEVSVIMPVFNCEPFIRESVESILSQTFTDFEFLIIDDASTDRTVEIIKEYDDARINLIVKPNNTGYTDSLNMAIRLAKGKYIARMDADDISLPQRLAVQHEHLEINCNVLVLGSHYKIIGSGTEIKLPVTYDEAKVVALMHVPVAHPTVMMQKKIFTEYGLWYNKNFEPAEDYDLWCRVLEIGKIENIDEVLLQYRHHDQQESRVKSMKVLKNILTNRQSQIEKLLTFPNDQYDVLFAIDVLTKNLRHFKKNELGKIKYLLDELVYNNKKKRIFKDNLLYNYLQEIWIYCLKIYPFCSVGDVLLLFSVPGKKFSIFNARFQFGRLSRVVGFILSNKLKYFFRNF